MSRSLSAGVKRRGEVVVRRVLEVTIKELARVGLARLSVPAIARRARVNKTSVYRRWPTKQALVRAALDRSMTRSHQSADTGSLAGDLEALGSSVGAFIGSPEGMGLLRTVFAEGHRPEVKALTASMWEGAGVPSAAVERAIARGEVSAGADVELLLFTLAGALLHRVYIERAVADEAFVERVVALLLGGFASSAPRSLGVPAAR